MLRAQLLSLATSPERVGWFSDALQQAVEYCDDETIGELLNYNDLKERIDSSNELRWTAIHRAADHGSLQVVTRLWEAGLTHSVNVSSPDHRSPLFMASSHGFAGIAEFLITKGARVADVNGSSERTALHIASHHGHWRTSRILLDRQANLTATDTEGNFSLHLAIRQRHIRVAELLVENFSDLLAASHASDHNTAAMLRSERGTIINFSDEDLLSPPLNKR
ncbi:ankyrin repeat-containing domain protein [Amylocarpus encephaloides]|uniref:Ankyrin repeat-containing domain protein n=1 Tax=Amylocarpus encephaloides TaxID=45428 RepID=A0A9P7Y8L8_9HELO|nr:ankyrin repeat-containing domain protein [Amylocarpus encephaloides]